MISSQEKLFNFLLEQTDDSDIKRALEELRAGGEGVIIPEQLIEDANEETQDEDAKTETLTEFLRSASIPQRIKLALLGNQTARSFLIRDANRQIAMFVLENPRITDNEIQDFSRNTNLDEGIFRKIAQNQQWMRNYSVKQSLVSNPKTPVDVSLRWLKFLNDKDLRLLAKSKNIPQVIGAQARKILETKSA